MVVRPRRHRRPQSPKSGERHRPRFPKTIPRPLIVWGMSVFVAFQGLFNYVLIDIPPGKEVALSYQRAIANPDVFGWFMIVFGLICAVGAFYAYTETLAGALLTAFAALWSFGFLASLLFFDAGLNATGPLGVWTFVAFVGFVTTQQVRGRRR